MDTRRWVAVLLSLVLLVTACAGNTINTTTTATDTTEAPATTAPPTTTPATTPTTVGGQELLPIPDAPPGSCFYLSGYLAVEEGQGPAAITALSGFDVGLEQVSPEEVLGDSTATGPLELAIDLLGTDVDPYDVASELENQGIAASPVYAVGLAAHWALAPGTDPISIPNVTIVDPPVQEGGDVIAVVDSGIADDRDGLPDWMFSEDVLYEDLDVETVGTGVTEASHGTFVTSLIRQIAPEYRVAFASARPIPLDLIVQREDALPANVAYVSTELHVGEAMVRLLQRDELNVENVKALNLSLGTYACDPEDDPTMVTTMAAMRLWFYGNQDPTDPLDGFANSTVFAAGGNEANSAPFWPAGLSAHPLDPDIDPAWVRGVGAINDDRQQIVWSKPEGVGSAGSVPQVASDRAWVTDAAPGCDLLGLRGGIDANGATVVAWSGSSFATAVSAATITGGTAPVSSGPVVEFDYSVPGLLYDDLGSCRP